MNPGGGKEGRRMNEVTKPHCDQEYYDMLEKLQVLDFTLVELNLYLDTHPEDLAALQQFNQMALERRHLAEHFQHLYGPLQNFGHSFSRYPWEWVNVPWPWQV
jgi:spore coat protein JB